MDMEYLDNAVKLWATLQTQADNASTEHGAIANQRAADQQLQNVAALAQVIQAKMLAAILNELEEIRIEIGNGNPN